MITQTTLSAAIPASPEPRRAALREWGLAPSIKNLETRLDAGPVVQACPPWRALLPVRFCRSEHEEPAHTAASHAPEILIANLELEFQLTYRKLSPLKIPNRKYSRVLRRRELYFRPFPYRLPTPSLEVCRSTRASLSVTSHSPLITHHSPLSTRLPRGGSVPTKGHALLIHGSAIKTRLNSFESNNVQISNRR